MRNGHNHFRQNNRKKLNWLFSMLNAMMLSLKIVPFGRRFKWLLLRASAWNECHFRIQNSPQLMVDMNNFAFYCVTNNLNWLIDDVQVNERKTKKKLEQLTDMCWDSFTQWFVLYLCLHLSRWQFAIHSNILEGITWREAKKKMF